MASREDPTEEPAPVSIQEETPAAPSRPAWQPVVLWSDYLKMRELDEIMRKSQSERIDQLERQAEVMRLRMLEITDAMSAAASFLKRKRTDYDSPRAHDPDECPCCTAAAELAEQKKGGSQSFSEPSCE